MIVPTSQQRVVEVTAGSRLHFGLYGFGHAGQRQFGGCGTMIDHPSQRLRTSAAKSFEIAGPLADRIETFVRRWMEFNHIREFPACRMELFETPPEHTGLGVGTQLALAVATSLNTFSELPQPSPLELALSVQRGLRSAVGTYGFLQGGFMAERGKLPQEPLAPLDVRIDFPASWRFVLVVPAGLSGISGTHELQAFASLPAVPEEVTARLIGMVREQMIPSLAAADFETCGELLYEYCHLAGLSFAPVQGGPYNGPVIASLVARLRSWGIRGVGQSSWGPTIFCLTSSAESARELTGRIQQELADIPLTVTISPPRNRGADVRVGDATRI